VVAPLEVPGDMPEPLILPLSPMLNYTGSKPDAAGDTTEMKTRGS